MERTSNTAVHEIQVGKPAMSYFMRDQGHRPIVVPKKTSVVSSLLIVNWRVYPAR